MTTLTLWGYELKCENKVVKIIVSLKFDDWFIQ